MRWTVQGFKSVTNMTQAVRDGQDQLAAGLATRKRTANERLYLGNMFDNLKRSNNVEVTVVAGGVIGQINAVGG